jgi:hypothetical protein
MFGDPLLLAEDAEDARVERLANNHGPSGMNMRDRVTGHLLQRRQRSKSTQRHATDDGPAKLTVNEEKTRICRMPDGEFDFLGYTFGRRYSAKTGRSYIASRPSRKSIKRMTEAVRIQTGRNMEWLDAREMVKCLNQKTRRVGQLLQSWSGYICIPIYRQVHHKPASPVVLREA